MRKGTALASSRSMIRLEQVRSEVLERFERVDRRFAASDQRLARIDQRTQELNDRLEVVIAALREAAPRLSREVTEEEPAAGIDAERASTLRAP
jgi:hypothetical protein